MHLAVRAGGMTQYGKSWQGKIAAGRFVLEKYLGGSDRHAVFATQVRELRNSQPATIKLVSASSCDAELQLAHWKKAAKLSHPHLLRIFESGHCWLGNEELLYIVIEYADENLGEVLPRRALTAAEAEAMLRPMADALTYLHKQGFVHGRIQPSNVLAVNDQLKVSSDGVVETGAAAGSSGVYSAPELTSGKLAPAADVWSLGMLLLYALKQRVPQAKPERAKLISDLPQPFAEIVRGCLRDNPSARISLADVLEKVQPAPEPIANAVKAAPSRKAFSPAMAGGLAVLALLLAIAAFFLVRHPSSSEQSAGAAPATAAASTASEPGAQTDQSPPARSQSEAEPQQPESNKVAEVPAVSQPASALSGPQTVVDRVMPKPAITALHTIHGTVRVRVGVNVNGSGTVSSARFIDRGPSNYFARLSMEAAQQWKFTPGTPSNWALLFEFTHEGTQVIPQQSKP